MKKKEAYMDILDKMPVNHREQIPSGKEQAYRNSASILKKLSHKLFIVRKIGLQFIIIRIM